MNTEIQRKLQEDMKLELKASQYALKRLETLIGSVQKQVYRQLEQRLMRVERLNAYPSVEAAHDAYGWGDITLDEFYEIREVLEKGMEYAQTVQTPKSVALDILKDYAKELRSNIRSFEYELMTPEQRCRHDRNVEEQRRRVREKKNRSR